MKYKMNVTVRGGISRPFYTGTVDIYPPDDQTDLRRLTYLKLKRTAFPEIMLDDVKINKAERME